ncbi:MAG: hypothetical protein ACFB2W_00755 [Leptolyngbyaceae cyanobacterium]
MHRITATTTPTELSQLKRDLMRLCGRYGAIGVVEALSEVAGDFSGEQGDMFARDEPEQAEIRSQWKTAWAILSQCSERLSGVFGH